MQDETVKEMLESNREYFEVTVCQKAWFVELSKKSAPRGIRTPVLGLKGPRPGPLDDGGNGRIVPRGQ